MAQEPPLTVAEVIQRLRLFNERAERLSRFTFLQKAFAPGAGATLHVEPGRAWQEKRGADEESTAAFAAVFRLFLQARDGIQLEQMEALYRQMSVPEENQYWVTENLNGLREFLDRTTTPELAINGVRLTHRMILETFLYGDIAHVNPKKRETYEVWRSGPAAMLLESTFEYVAGEVAKFIFWLAKMNENAIRVLENLSKLEITP